MNAKGKQPKQPEQPTPSHATAETGAAMDLLDVLRNVERNLPMMLDLEQAPEARAMLADVSAALRQHQPETRTLQLWPSGRSVTYRGAHPTYRVYRGTGRPSSLRYGWTRAWREEARDIRAEELARMYSDRDILCCDSSLVSDCLKLGQDVACDFAQEWDYDQIVNLYPNPADWDVEQCREWLAERGIDGPDESDELDELGDWQETVRAHAEPAEIYEWWRVTPWLAGHLKAIGQPVLDNVYGTWWGRTCTGQGYLMDGTLQAVARRFVD